MIKNNRYHLLYLSDEDDDINKKNILEFLSYYSDHSFF